MDNIVRSTLKTKIESLKGTAFQDALDRILLCIYDEDNFQRIKQKHDQGSDGILHKNTIIAAYAPEKYAMNDFQKKISDDFKSYQKNWESTHNKWVIYTNLESLSSMIKFVDRLKKGTTIVCIDRLLEIISSQNWHKIITIFNALDIPDMYIKSNVLSYIIEDLSKTVKNDDKFIQYEKQIYFEEKIILNVREENISIFLDEYEENLASFSTIKSIIRSYDQSKISTIRNKIRSIFMNTSGDFEARLSSTIKTLSESKYEDDFYLENLRKIVLYFFEQCLFGRKTDSEENIIC